MRHPTFTTTSTIALALCAADTEATDHVCPLTATCAPAFSAAATGARPCSGASNAIT